MSTRKPSPKSRPSDAADDQVPDSRPLTVNVPTEVLHRAKTRASLEGVTLSAIVSDALTTYAEGLPGVLAQFGLNKPAK